MTYRILLLVPRRVKKQIHWTECWSSDSGNDRDAAEDRPEPWVSQGCRWVWNQVTCWPTSVRHGVGFWRARGWHKLHRRLGSPEGAWAWSI